MLQSFLVTNVLNKGIKIAGSKKKETAPRKMMKYTNGICNTIEK